MPAASRATFLEECRLLSVCDPLFTEIDEDFFLNAEDENGLIFVEDHRLFCKSLETS